MPLDLQTRQAMERAYSFDFSRVRIHADYEADSLNHALNARAFTTGSDVFFSHNAYRPTTREGQLLLGHELAHALQQRQVRPSGPPQLGSPDDAYEREAEAVSTAVSDAVQRRDFATVPARPVGNALVDRPIIQRQLPAGLAAAGEVLEVGLTAAIVLQEQYAITEHGLTYNHVQAARIGKNPQPMSGEYSAEIFTAATGGSEVVPGRGLSATFRIFWEGNDDGEIGAAHPEVDLSHSEFRLSSLNVHFMPLENLRRAGDIRAWPMQWTYHGNFNPAGAGEYEFQGKFEINAFGLYQSVSHEVMDRTTSWSLGERPDPYGIVKRGPETRGGPLQRERRKTPLQRERKKTQPILDPYSPFSRF